MDRHHLEPVDDRVQTVARVALRDPGPPGEVRDRRGSAGGEVLLGEAGEGLLGGGRILLSVARRNPLVEEHERLVMVLHRAAADQRLLREHPQDVVAALLVGGDAVGLEERHRVRALEYPAAGEGLREELAGHFEVGVGQAELLVALGCPRGDARREQREHPAHVGGRQQVQGAAHRPGADDAALGDRGLDVGCGGARSAAQANRPQRARVVLGLHRAEMLDRGGGVALGSACRPLDELTA